MKTISAKHKIEELIKITLFLACSSLSAQEFHGYDCTDDCSGHEAGYAWAERNDITDPDDCGGNSNSFIEGCIAYAEEYQESYGDSSSYDDDSYTEDGELCEDYPDECEDDW